MYDVKVTLSLPRSLLAAAGLRTHELDRFVLESVVVDLYRQGKISLGKAMEVAGVPTKWEMMSVLARHGVWIDYTADDAREDWITLTKVLGR